MLAVNPRHATALRRRFGSFSDKCPHLPEYTTGPSDEEGFCLYGKNPHHPETGHLSGYCPRLPPYLVRRDAWQGGYFAR